MRTIILLLIYVILVVLILPVLLFCYLGRWTQPIIAIGKWALCLGRKVLGMSLEVSGVKQIDKNSPCVFMANHLSLIDGPLLFMIIPQYVRVIIKKEVFRIPIVGQGMRHVKFIPVDRKRLRGGKESIDEASRLIKEKDFSFLIFPEGTRSRNGKPQPFKRGGFFLALSAQVPIVPVTIKGTYELMPRGSFFAKRGKIKVLFHPPIPTDGFDRSNLPQLINKVQKVIRSELDE